MALVDVLGDKTERAIQVMCYAFAGVAVALVFNLLFRWRIDIVLR